MSELRFEDVRVRYGATLAVDGVSLTVPAGQVVGLVGESGSGKSTLARAAVGLAPVSEGTITLDGRPVPTKGRNRPLQMVFQDPYSSLDPRMSIGESIAEAIPPGSGRAERKAEVLRLLELVHLDPTRSAARPSELSGGQRQRDLGLSMLFISHNLAVVRYVATHVAVMHQGRIVEEGPTAQVLAAPEHDYTRELLAAVPGKRNH